MKFFAMIAAGMMGLCLGPAQVQAAEASFPSRPIKILVPFAPGGTSDNLARTLANAMQSRLKVSVIVENKPGGSGAIAIEDVAHAPANGYTLLWGTDAVIVQPLLHKDFPVKVERDLEPLARVGYTPMLFVANKRLPAGNIQQLISMAKANPGKLRYGSGGTGTVLHITGERFNLAAGIDIAHIPYKGTKPAVLDAMAGHIELAVTGVSEVIPLVLSGDVKALAYTGDVRYPTLPDVPTVAESGYPGFFAAGWAGVLAPAGLPPGVAQRLADEIVAAARTPEFRKVADTAGMISAIAGPSETAAYLRTQSGRYREVIEKARITAE